MSDSLRTSGAAKVVAAKGNAMSTVITQLAEVVVGWGAIWLRYTEHLSEQNLMIVIGAIVAGPFISHARGKGDAKVPTTVMLGGIGGAVAAAVKKVTIL